MKKNNNKGFTLVELIVVLVILAILAAILVPALLGYIDRAREKQVTTNAEAALVAAQGKMADAYKDFSDPAGFVTEAEIKDLTEISEDFTAYYVAKAYNSSSIDKAMYKITVFAYYSDAQKQTAVWDSTNGQWKVTPGDTAKDLANGIEIK
ncbi:MAG: type II secretion system GspH family protein [Eubacterium sp.]|nr:type II secretion system GspH family protein [Eubacterium sp.]